MIARALRWLGLASVIAAAAPIAAARADESPAPPRHLAAYGLDWLDYVSPDDIPPTRYAVCIVDSGTRVTPDTPEDGPVGPVLERLSIDAGSGTPQGDDPAQLHGTRMAMSAIAAKNGWGTIGVADWERVVTVRAQVEGELGFRESAYRKGIVRCQEAASRHPIAAVSLSIGCPCDLSQDEQAKLTDAISAARNSGLSVVAAAGNGGGATESPARYAGILAVAGGDTTGVLCSYSSYDARVAIVGPACPVDDADPLSGLPASDFGGGSSVATVTVATVITAVRTLRPDANADQVQDWLVGSSRQVDGRRVLDGSALALAAGLEAVADRARDRMSTSASSSPPEAATSPTPSASRAPAASVDHSARTPRLSAPRIDRAVWRSGQLRVHVASRPVRARLEVRAVRLAEFGFPDRSVRRVRAARRLAVHLRWRPDRLAVRFVPMRGQPSTASPTRILRRTKTDRFR